MATQILTQKTSDPQPPLTRITNRQLALAVGRKAVACLLGELDPASFDRADLRTARAILGELLAETEAAQ